MKEDVHGVEISDPYRWLEETDSPETRQWIKAQNEYAESLLGSFPWRERLKSRLTELMRVDRVEIPLARGDRYFFQKQFADQELSLICIRKGLKGEDQVLIDPHNMSPDHTTSVRIEDISEDGAVMAYAVQDGGQDESAIDLLDAQKNENLKDGLPKARYIEISLKPDGSGFYYVRHEKDGERVYYHAIGTDIAADPEIFGEGYGPDKIISARVSEDGRHLLICVLHGAAATKTEVYVQDLANNSAIRTIVNHIDAAFNARIGDGQLFLHTNWGARRWRIFRVGLSNPILQKWEEIIPESEDTIEDFAIAGERLLVNFTHNVVSRVRVFDFNGRYLREIETPPVGTVLGMSAQSRTNEAFFQFSSFHIPPTTYRYDAQTGSKEEWWRTKVPIDSGKFEVKQVWYDSKDRTKIPMFIVHAKDIDLDGSNPTLLTGYGGFRISMTPWFSTRTALWIEAGGVFAQPSLRGGSEFGEEWHKAGMLEKKQNVFDDFISAAEWLIQNRYTKSEKLAISGGSNGGLLVGAALTQRPELFSAVVCTYPLLDMVRYHKFLVAPFWIPEYGSSEDPDQFRYLYAYSPYHRVKIGTPYPAVLLITGDFDTRVDPLHARKMTALLQSATTSGKPVLLRYHAKAGHSGGQPMSRQIDDLVHELSFLFWQLGAEPRLP